jgi:hypothetical protein
MLHRIEHAAKVSVARACGFAALAIFTFMVGLSADMAAAFRTGGLLSLVVCIVLLIKARHAATKSYKSTEVWVMLDPQERPHSAIAQQIIGTVLRETFLYFAQHAAFASALLLGGALVYGVLFPLAL